MSEIVLPADGIKNVNTLIQAMRTTVRNYWTQAGGYQKFLYAIGALFLLSGLFHTGVLIVTGGSLAGPVSWRKPIIFGFSIGVTCLSIGWVLTFLPKHRLIGWLLSGALGISFLVELFLIDMQQWRGVPSHFNYSTPFDAAVFNIMGTMIVLVEIVIVLIALWTFFSLKAPPSLAWAIRLGMVLLVVSQIFGNLIIANGIPQVLDFQTGEFISEGVNSAYIFGAAGSMKVPHALTLHAIQVLPLLAFLLLFTNWSESRRLTAVMVAAVGYTGLVIVSAFQTFSGLALFDMNLLAGLGFGISAVNLIVAYAAAWSGSGKPSPSSTPLAAGTRNEHQPTPRTGRLRF
jgi:hypothetical protein